MATQAELDLIHAALSKDPAGIERATERVRAERRPQLPPQAEQELRAAAADWMETEIGQVYGQVVLAILDGERT